MPNMPTNLPTYIYSEGFEQSLPPFRTKSTKVSNKNADFLVDN